MPLYTKCRLGIVVVIFCSALAIQSAKATELRINYTSTEEIKTLLKNTEPLRSGEEPKSELTTKTTKLSVVVGKTYFVLELDGGATLYDLVGKRIYTRSSTGNTWTDHSLFADVFFRVMEFQNREVLAGALRAGGVSSPMMLGMRDTFDLECLFGLRFPNTHQNPVKDLKTETLEKGGFRFVKGDEVAACLFSTVNIPNSLQPVYSRALTYLNRLHPEIRARIVEAGKVPQQLSVRWYNTGTIGKTVWYLESASLDEKDSYAIPAADEISAFDAASPLTARIQAALVQAEKAPAPTLETVGKAADQAIADGRPIDGMLGLFELLFQTGTNISPELARRRNIFSTDSRCQEFLAARDQSSKEACEKSVAALRSFDRKNLTKGYVVDIHIADGLSSLGRLDEAEKLFLSTLDRNPLLAGVWNDLGQAYSRGYEMEKAWICWDFARRIAPKHRMLAGLTDIEERLMRDFPDFFLPPGS